MTDNDNGDGLRDSKTLVPNVYSLFVFHTFDIDGPVFGAVCFVTSLEVQRSCGEFSHVFPLAQKK